MLPSKEHAACWKSRLLEIGCDRSVTGPVYLWHGDLQPKANDPGERRAAVQSCKTAPTEPDSCSGPRRSCNSTADRTLTLVLATPHLITASNCVV